MSTVSEDPRKGISRREALWRASMMVGGALAAPMVSGLLSGCRADSAPDWTPQVFSTEENDLMTTICERIIPATDTPGAEAAQVNRFIDKMLADWYPAEEKDRFLRGLASVDRRAQAAHGTPFMELTADDQTALLSRMDEALYTDAPEEPAAQESAEASADSASTDRPDEDVVAQGQGGETVEETEPSLNDDTTGTGALPGGQDDTEEGAEPVDEVAFFRWMKGMTLAGYYTSEIGATQELRHQVAFPGYEGCIPYGPKDRTWA